MTSSIVRPLAAVALASTLLLSACGGSDSDSGSSDKDSSSSDSSSKDDSSDDAEGFDATPADGDTITGTGFEFTVPQGWKDSKKSMPSALALAIDTGDKDGFSDNVNVVPDNTVANVDRDDLEDAVEKVLKSVNAKDIDVQDPVTIDGEEAVHVSAIFEQNGTKYRTEQYAMGHDDKGYVVTVSFNEDTPDDQREEVAGSILTTWKWS